MRIWTQSEVEFLKNNYQKMKYSLIAKILKRTESSIWGQCHKLGLIKGYHNLWNKQRVIKELNQFKIRYGKSPSARQITISLLRACERYFGSLNNAKKIAGLEVRNNINSLPIHARKPSKELAYITGALMGDGSFRLQKSKKRTSYVIAFSTIDMDFLNAFINNFKKWSGYSPKFSISDGRIMKSFSGKRYDTKKFYTVQIGHKEACLFLRKFKLNPILCLTFFPRKYWGWLIKGLWDAEGSIINVNNKYLRIIFTNYDKKIISLFRKTLELKKIPFSLQKYRNTYPNIEILTNKGKMKFLYFINGITIKRKLTSEIMYLINEINIQI